jgi:hypothetical protein
MRIGINPIKNNKEILIENYHRIVIPVYIPNFEGYFAGSFDVFKLCLESLLLTIHSKTRITIYNNNSHSEVKEYIDIKYSESEFIDQVFHSKENVGKINAILAVVKGNLEPLITITDADVLYKNNWQKAIEDLFIGFPEAGMICPVPMSSNGTKSFVNNNWYYGFFKGKLKFEKVLDPDAMMLFDKSLGNKKSLLKPIHLEKYLVLKNKENTNEAVMGGGHFAATLRRDVFDKGSNEPAFMKIVGGVENKFIDFPNQKLGFLRIATKKNYAFHMGNSLESWMHDEFNALIKEPNSTNLKHQDFITKPISKTGRFLGYFIQKLMNKNNFIRFKVLNKLGLNAKDY